MSDAHLLERFERTRDETAFETLLHRHGGMVLGVCRRVLHHAHDVEDAFQATFLVLARKAGAIRKRASVGSWLYGVAYRIAVKAKVTAARRLRHERQAARVAVTDLLADAAWDELRTVVDEELGRMPEKCRVSFILCCLEGKTHEQAAREVGWPAGSMSRWLARGRELLRERLARRGFALTAGALLGAVGEQAARAAVPPALLDETLRATLSRAAGATLTQGIVSARAASWADAAGRTMFTGQFTLAARAFLVLAILAAGIGLSTGKPATSPAAKTGGPRKQAANVDKPPTHDSGPALESVKKRLLHRFGGNALSETAVAAGLNWLAHHQAKDGHWSLEGFEKDSGCACKDHSSYRNDIAGTAFGLLPMLGAGYSQKPANTNPYSRNVQAGLKYLTTKLDKKTGDFGGGMYAQGLATMALCEAYGLTRDPQLKASAQAAVDYVLKAQHQAGGWRYAPGQAGDTSVTGWQIQALVAAQASELNVPAPALSRAEAYLDSCESATDHGYSYVPGGPSTPSMTAVALLCRSCGPVKAAGRAHLKNGIASLMSRAPRRVKDMYFYYFATKALHLHGGESWHKWNEKMRAMLIREQDQGATVAHQKGSWSPEGDLQANAGGRLMSTSLSLLTLEVYYRSDLVLALGPRVEPTAMDLDALWKSLGDDHGMKARQAVWTLAKAPEKAAPFLRKQLQPSRSGGHPKNVDRLIDDLDSVKFSTRNRASAALEKLADVAEPALRKAVRGKSSVEVVRRATEILERLNQKTAAARARNKRAIDALELMSRGEGRDVLMALAKGEEGAWLTDEAKQALRRLSDD